MAHSNILQIARSWVGHLATDQEVRDRLNVAMGRPPRARSAALAELINETVGPAESVAADDVEEIMENVAMMYKGTTERGGIPSSDGGVFSVCVGGHGIEEEEADDEAKS